MTLQSTLASSGPSDLLHPSPSDLRSKSPSEALAKEGQTSPSMSDARILKACEVAESAKADFSIKAVIAGALLNEKRLSPPPSSHDGTTVGQPRRKGRFDADEAAFYGWLEANFPGKGRTTLYRWMQAAERLVKGVLKINPTDDLPLDFSAAVGPVPISQILTAPEAQLTPDTLFLRRAIFDLMTRYTITDAINGVVEGDSAGHRITRAINGLGGGTGGEDRKDFAFFVARKFQHISEHFTHWEAMSQTQRLEAQQAIRAAINGSNLELPDRKHLFKFEAWPEEICQTVLETVKDRLRSK